MESMRRESERAIWVVKAALTFVRSLKITSVETQVWE